MYNPSTLEKYLYIDVREFSLQQNADNFIKVGWKLLGIYVGFTEDKTPSAVYRVGWLVTAGEPVRPQIIDEVPLLQFQDLEPSVN